MISTRSHHSRIRALSQALALVCAALMGAACTWFTGPDEPVLRIHNAGAEAIHGLEVTLPESWLGFGTVPPGSTTAYQRVRGPVFSYAGMSFIADGRRTGGLVLDWNDTPLAGRKFTYVVAMARSSDDTPSVRIVAVIRD